MSRKNQEKMKRNSLMEFVAYSIHAGEGDNEMIIENGILWVTQRKMSVLLDATVPTINDQLERAFSQGELEKEKHCRAIQTLHQEGGRSVSRMINFYSLEALIAVCYRVNTENARNFRSRTLEILAEFVTKGFALDKERLMNGGFLNEEYYDELIESIQEIRASERNFYQKITDIYATSIDYDKKAETTRRFFAHVQDKLHFAVHGNTAAELIMARADSTRPQMGLTTWADAPDGKIKKSDVTVAKNYLKKEEMKNLNEIVEMFLAHATRQARRKIPMTMNDWERILNAFLVFEQEEVLEDFGRVKRAIANQFALSEFEKYRPIQDRIFKSDFDKFSKELLNFLSSTKE